MQTRTLVVLALVACTVVATHFDYVIVGGGVAGSIVANRLSAAYPRADIAIIEAGDNQTANPLVSTPSRAFSQTSTNLRYNWFADAEPLFANQKLLVQQGRGLGGGSIANQYAYERSLPVDYDNWAEAVGDDSWNYENILPLYKKSQKASPGLSPAYHGSNGPLNVVESLTTCSFARAWINVAGELGQQTSSDLNGAQSTGFGFEQSTINPATLLRDDANTAFLTPAAKNRNVVIFKNTVATRILLRRQGRKQKAYGVVVVDPFEGEITIRGKQVIIAAGALSTPGLLMRSGIGAPEKLAQHGIETIVPLSGVGENLIDNYSFIVSYSGTIGACPFPTRPVLHLNTTEYATDAFIIANPRATSISFVIMNPKHDSRGTVNLNSASPFDVPKITLNVKSSFFNNMISSINLVRQITSSRTFTSTFGTLTETAPGATVQTPAALTSFIAANIGFAPHFAGTCKMGKEGDSTAVVDSKFRVFGVEDLRVIDSSVVPIMTRNGMYAIATLVGEKGAEAIINDN